MKLHQWERERERESERESERKRESVAQFPDEPNSLFVSLWNEWNKKAIPSQCYINEAYVLHILYLWKFFPFFLKRSTCRSALRWLGKSGKYLYRTICTAYNNILDKQRIAFIASYSVGRTNENVFLFMISRGMHTDVIAGYPHHLYKNLLFDTRAGARKKLRNSVGEIKRVEIRE